jgi:hypothetical protein
LVDPALEIVLGHLEVVGLTSAPYVTIYLQLGDLVPEALLVPQS